MQEEHISKISAPSAQIDFAKGVTLSGITEIVSSSDKSFVARAGENVLTVQGEGLSPRLVDTEKRTAMLSGRIYSVSSAGQLSPKGFFSKLFK